VNRAFRKARDLAKRGVAIRAGTCLLQVRTVMGIQALGDYDGDGAADAEDAWKRAKADGDTHPITSTTRIPRGAAVFWGGGSNDNGHVAIATGYGTGNDATVWSPGVPSDSDHWRKVTIRAITWGWGLELLGYSTSLNGEPIPDLGGR
jgi:hypothetical protein